MRKLLVLGVFAASPAMADAFCAARLGPGKGHLYGVLPAGTDCRRVLERAWPDSGHLA